MKNTITEALIYEDQGLKDDALNVYKNILKVDPTNKDAISAIHRLSGVKKDFQKDVRALNQQMKDFFVKMRSEQEINEFKRWLIRL